jgi:hypothetical protein
MTGKEILDALISGEVTDAEVIEAVNEARRRERSEKVMAAQNTLRHGSVVVIHGITPKRLNGTIGEICGFNKTHTRADLKVERSSDPFGYRTGEIVRGIPLVCLETEERP